ncbi:MAG: PIN domain-containing protein [bacterium]|nr:PIN domain-containing protein [bacterium]
MKRQVVLDTGPLVALLNHRDRYHSWARDRFADIEPPLTTCEAVVVESCHLLREQPGGERVVLDVIRRGAVEIDFALRDEIVPIQQLRTRYADVPMDLADACLVRMVELSSGSAVLTLDSDFSIYRMHGRRVIPTISP